MAAAVTPDVEHPALPAQGLLAAIAQDNGITLVTDLTGFTVGNDDHERLSLNIMSSPVTCG